MQVSRKSYTPVSPLAARAFHKAAIYAAEVHRLLRAGRRSISNRHAREQLEVLAAFSHQLVIAISKLEQEITLQLLLVAEEHEDVA